MQELVHLGPRHAAPDEAEPRGIGLPEGGDVGDSGLTQALSQTVAEARALLDTAYRWLDKRMTGREWASGDSFGLADCAAAPALFYADWTHPISDVSPHVRAYRKRLLLRPSFARAVDEARQYRPLFPLGAPDRG